MKSYDNRFQRTVDLYPWFIFFKSCQFWGPVFFLYFSSRCTTRQVLLLEAVYYCSVSLLEVPSGYFSDKISRKLTLLISTVFMCLAYLLFFSGAGFFMFAVAQICLAVGFSFASGTDTALHFEALKAVKKEGQYLSREAKATGMAFLAGALSAVAGGLSGAASMHYVYGASFMTSTVSVILVLLMRDPAMAGPSRSSLHFINQVRSLARKAVGKELKLTFLFAVFMTVLIHIPYEFYQPYLAETVAWGASGSGTSLLTGVHLAVTMIIGAYSTRYITQLSSRFEIWNVLLFMALLLVVMISLMAVSYNPVVAVLLFMRTVPKAIATPMINAMLSSRLQDHERSTFLSIQSLCGRLVYGAVLAAMSLISSYTHDPVKGALTGAAVVGVLLFLFLVNERVTRSRPAGYVAPKLGENASGGPPAALRRPSGGPPGALPGAKLLKSLINRRRFAQGMWSYNLYNGYTNNFWI